MKRLIAKFVLWSNDYCTRHLKPKTPGMFGFWCADCNAEYRVRKNEKIQRAKALLRK